MSTITVDVVTPQRVVFSGAVAEIRVSGQYGEFGVLAQHAHLLSNIRAGILTLVGESATTRFLVGRGFAEAGPDRVVVLTDSCEDPAGIDKDAARQAYDEALTRRGSEARGSEAWKIADRDVEMAAARMSA